MSTDTPSRASVAALALVSSMFWLATPSVAVSQSRRSTIVAGVADRDAGEPLSGAEVVLVDSDRAARANALGEAVLAGVAVA